MDLRYDISIVGLRNVDRALSSMETRFARHNAKVSRMFRGPGGRRARGGPAGVRASQMREGANVDRMAAKRIRAEKRVADAKISGIKVAERVEIASVERIARKQRKAQAKARSQVRRATGFVGRSVRSTVARGAAFVGSLVGIGGGMIASDALNTERRANASAARLANQAYGTEGGMAGGRRLTREQIKSRALTTARLVGNESGLGKGAVLGAMGRVQAISGRFDIAREMAPYMAELSDASGAELGDVGETTGQVLQSVMLQLKHVKDPQKRKAEAMRQTRAIMDVVAGQAKIGSIEMPEMAKHMASLMSASASYKSAGGTADTVNTLGALMQTAMAGGASTPAESANAIKRFTDDITDKGSKARGVYKKLGVDVFNYEKIDGKRTRTSVRDPAAVLTDTMKKSHGDLGTLNKLFGVRGRKVAAGFRKLYTDAGGGDKGVKAIMDQIEMFRSQKMSDRERRESAAFTRNDPARAWDREMVKLKDEVGQKLLPVLIRVTPRLAELIEPAADAAEGMAKLAEWVTKNPYEGVAAIIGAKVAADVAAAGVGLAVRETLVRILTATGALGAAPGAGGAAPGAVGAAGGWGATGLLALGVAGEMAGGLGGFMEGRDIGAAMGLGKTGQAVVGGALGYANAITPWGALTLGRRAIEGKSLNPLDDATATGARNLDFAGIAGKMAASQWSAGMTMEGGGADSLANFDFTKGRPAGPAGGPGGGGADKLSGAAAKQEAAADALHGSAAALQDVAAALSTINPAQPRA